MKRSTCKVLIIAALVICMSFAMPGLDAFAVTVGDLTVGVDVGRITLFQSQTLESCEFKSGSGSIPPGLELTYTKNGGVYLKNTPTTAGVYSFSCTVTTADGAQDLDVSVYVVEPVVDEPVYEGDKYLPVSTPEPTAKPVQTVPNITKHPTGETVEVGGTAKFVSRADNATKHTWRLVSADTTCTYKASEADYYFPGLEVSGIDTEKLVLSNIPESLSGWCVECKFENANGASYSNGARITVNNSNKPAATAAPAATKAPAANSGSNNTNTQAPAATAAPVDPSVKTANITTHPKGAQVKKGETLTLNAYATSPNNGDISYQWYSSPVNDKNAALPISGATSESYEVTPTAEAVYYWCAAWNTWEGKRSEPVFTQAAEVMLIPEATPTPAPTPTPIPVEDDGGDFISANLQLILFGAIGLLALAALIGVVIYLRIEAKREDE